jgi:hypothetical protein
MKKVIFIIVCLMSAVLVGCGIFSDELDTDNSDKLDDFDDKMGIEGYVLAKDNGRILVVDPIPQDFSANGGVSEFYNAIWLSGDTEQIDIGETVRAWFDAVAESYPGQAKATRISLIKSKKVGGADLNEAEVVRRALTSDELNVQAVVAIKSVAYDKATDSWKVIAKQGEDEFNIEVIDTKTDLGDSADNAGDIPEVPLRELEDTFRNGIYQEVDETTRKVKNFDTKAQWVQYMSEIMDKSLAETFANDFFNEKENGLYLISRSGPVVLVFEEPYEIEVIDGTKVQAIQKGENILLGKYQLTVTYEYREGNWIITERQFLSDDLYPTDKFQ